MTNNGRNSGKPSALAARRSVAALAVIVLWGLAGLVLGGMAVTLDNRASTSAAGVSLSERLADGWRHHRFALLSIVGCSTLIGVAFYSRRSHRKAEAEIGGSDGPPSDTAGHRASARSQLEQLQETGANIFDLYDLSPTAFLLVDRAGDICSANDRAADLFGYSKRRLIGMRLSNLAYDRSTGESATEFILQRTAAGHSTQDRELQMATADGARLWVSLSSRPVMDRQGRALLSGLAAVDVGERKRAEEALRESEERFRRSFDESPIGAAIVSLDYRFRRVNAELCRLTGYDEKELTALGLADISHVDELDETLSALKALQINEREQYRADRRLVRRDGSIVWVQVAVRLHQDADVTCTSCPCSRT